MRLVNLKFSNLTAFGEAAQTLAVEHGDTSRVTAIVGPSSSGKTATLEAARFLHRAVATSLGSWGRSSDFGGTDESDRVPIEAGWLGGKPADTCVEAELVTGDGTTLLYTLRLDEEAVREETLQAMGATKRWRTLLHATRKGDMVKADISPEAVPEALDRQALKYAHRNASPTILVLSHSLGVGREHLLYDIARWITNWRTLSWEQLTPAELKRLLAQAFRTPGYDGLHEPLLPGQVLATRRWLLGTEMGLVRGTDKESFKPLEAWSSQQVRRIQLAAALADVTAKESVLFVDDAEIAGSHGLRVMQEAVAGATSAQAVIATDSTGLLKDAAVPSHGLRRVAASADGVRL